MNLRPGSVNAAGHPDRKGEHGPQGLAHGANQPMCQPGPSHLALELDQAVIMDVSTIRPFIAKQAAWHSEPFAGALDGPTETF